MDDEDRYKGRGGLFETIEQDDSDGRAQCNACFDYNIHI